MLSAEQLRIIVEQTNADTAQEFIKVLLNTYASKEVYNILDVLSYIPELVEKSICMKQDTIDQYSWATTLLLTERYTNPISARKTRKGAKVSNEFPTLLYACIAHFPDGKTEHKSEAEKAFFNEFVDYVRNKRGFDYDNVEDWEWLTSRTDNGRWLVDIIRRNIDEGFKPPISV